jgi:hypothetical protein
VKQNDGERILTKEITVNNADNPKVDMLQPTGTAPTSAPVAGSETPQDNTYVYAGAGLGVLGLLGVGWMTMGGGKKKKAKAEDPFAGLEGMPGMEGVDFAALGLDDSALTGIGPVEDN